MASAFTINEDLINKLHERIRHSAEEVRTESNTTPISFLLYDVVITEIFPKISQSVIREIIEVCLWASLEKEEGKFNNFSVVFQPPNPDDSYSDYKFKQDIEFNSTNLKKIAPAFNSNNYQIGIWFDENDKLIIWGFKQKLVWFLSINSVSPGKLLVNCLSGINNSFKCPITLSETGLINPFSPKSNPIADWLSSDLISLLKRGDIQSVFSQMFDYGCGGAVLLVRESQEKWKDSMKEIPYENDYFHKYTYGSIFLKYEAIKEFQAMVEEKRDLLPIERENRANKLTSTNLMALPSLNAISNLTKIDGAIVLSENLNVLAFGAKIGATEKPKRIVITEPFEDSEVKEIDISEWKVGTRHTSAAEFVNEQRDCLAVVVSEDRKVSVISWDETRKLVKVTKNFEWMIFD